MRWELQTVATILGTALLLLVSVATQECSIPDDLLGAFGAYPNLLNLTDEDRVTFHPVLKFPKGDSLRVMDHRYAKGLATLKEIQQAKRWAWWRRFVARPLRHLLEGKKYAIGRYDENRVSMYSSEHFQNTTNQIDGYGGQRTVHLGIDLDGPAGSPVYAFENGVVHKVGFNSDYGDYGHVIVLRHTLPSGVDVWALYGHLDRSTVKKNTEGAVVRKGAVIGRVGDCHENGGWAAPHVHFQISLTPPETHDMPGASSIDDRPKALLQYPDPRLILGPLY